MTLETLLGCLQQVEAADLLGIRLVAASPRLAHPPADLSRETLKQAVNEMVDYTTRCNQVTQGLTKLTPVALPHIECPEVWL